MGEGWRQAIVYGLWSIVYRQKAQCGREKIARRRGGCKFQARNSSGRGQHLFECLPVVRAGHFLQPARCQPVQRPRPDGVPDEAQRRQSYRGSHPANRARSRRFVPSSASRAGDTAAGPAAGDSCCRLGTRGPSRRVRPPIPVGARGTARPRTRIPLHAGSARTRGHVPGRRCQSREFRDPRVRPRGARGPSRRDRAAAASRGSQRRIRDATALRTPPGRQFPSRARSLRRCRSPAGTGRS